MQHCPKLQYVNFSETTVKKESIDIICRELRDLKRVYFYSYENEVGDDSVQYLTSLTEFIMFNCKNVTDVGLKPVAEENHWITVLDLRGCKEVTDEAVVALIEAQPVGQLVTVKLGTSFPKGNIQTLVSRRVVDCIAKRCFSVTTLYLMNISLISEDLVLLMQHCRRVGGFGFIGNITLWKEIGAAWSLKLLEVSKSPLDNNGLRDVLMSCQELRTLYLDSCTVSDGLLDVLLQWGKNIRKMRIYFSKLGQEEQNRITAEFPYCRNIFSSNI